MAQNNLSNKSENYEDMLIYIAELYYLKGLSQQQIADECMISQSTYSGYESGNYLITALVLYTICKNHNLSLDEFLK